MAKNKLLSNPTTLIFIVFLIIIFLNPFIIINAGQRGVLMRFGKVQEQILEEGIHLVIPLVDTVQKLSIRIQKQEIAAESSTKDLQEVFTDLVLNWHIIPERTNLIFQTIGEQTEIIDRIINPAIEEIVKAVMAKYTAEEIIIKREQVKTEVDNFLTKRLLNYYINIDDISLVHVHFSPRFTEAVEAKQIAEQEAKKAGFRVLQAMKDAEVKINLAKGEAEANRILQESLTPEILKRQAVNKWNGNLPLIMGNEELKLLNLDLKDLKKS